MEWGIQLREPGHVQRWDDAQRELAHLYDPKSLGDRDGTEEARPALGRIYIGDEFCPNRLPSMGELADFCRFAEKKALGVTLLVPFLTDEGIERWAP
jgi:hypothetical protein